MAAAAILNLEKMSNFGLDKDILHQIIWEDAPWPCGDDHVTKIRNRKLIRETMSISVLIWVIIADIWTKFYVELKHHNINMKECYKFTRLENPRWWRPPSWISEKVNNSELDRAICAKFDGQIHHGHAEITHDQNWKPALVCVTSLLQWIKMYILNECQEHNRCADVDKSTQLPNL